MINPIPLKVSENWMRGDYSDLKEQSYRGRGFAEATVNQIKFYHEHEHYSFEKALQDTDCGMDLYSFGYLLMCLISEDIKRLDVDYIAWNIFWGEFQKWIKDDLMDHEYGLVHPYSRSNLPHDTYIAMVEKWIAQVDTVLGYSSERLTFEVNNEKLMKKVKDKESKLAYIADADIEEYEAIQKPKKSKIKKIIAGIILIPVVLFILLMIMVDDDTAPSQESIKTETNINSVALTTATQDITKAVTDTPITLPTPVYNHYILTANTVQDTKSGLIWRYCPVGRFGSTGECMGETSLLTYPEMVSEIDNLNTQNKSLGIQGAWRLPTLKEIETIKLCDKSITALTIDNKPVDISYACKSLANAKSSDFF